MAHEPMKKDLIAKLLIIGDSKVGKSSILTRFTEDYFSTSTVPTLGIDYKIKKVTIDSTELKLQIWDTAGQERFKSITLNFFKGAMGVIICFDLTDRDTFESVQPWVQNVQENAGAGGPNGAEKVAKVLVGNKADLPEKRQVTTQEGEEMAKKLGIKYYETSAKENLNITESFMFIAKEIKNTLISDPIYNPKIKIDSKSQSKKKKEGCNC